VEIMFELIYRFDPANPEVRQNPRTADEARQILVQGNRDFAESTDARRTDKRTRVIPFDPRAFGWGMAEGDAPAQAPFAAVLGCADARVPTEMVFSKGCIELFVVRVAGNVLGQECLGSLHYAVHHFPNTLKLIVVLAHGRCGAVTEAVDIYLQPGRYLQIANDFPIRSIEDQILVTVRVAAMTMEALYGPDVIHKPECRSALIEAGIVLNAAWSAYCLRLGIGKDFPGLGVAFGTYDLSTRYVRLPLSPPSEITEEEKGLFTPPEDVEGFRQLSHRICAGPLVRKLLRVDQ
jgi:carbonic anhydrase